MMQKLADDPSFWIAVAAVLAWVTAWAKVKAAEYEARSANGKADTVAAGQGVQQVTLVQHTAQIAALEAVQGAVSPGTPAPQGAGAGQPTLSGVIGLPSVQSLPPSVTGNATPLPASGGPAFPAAPAVTPTGEPVPPSASPPATERQAGGSGIVPPQNGDPPPPES